MDNSIIILLIFFLVLVVIAKVNKHGNITPTESMPEENNIRVVSFFTLLFYSLGTYFTGYCSFLLFRGKFQGVNDGKFVHTLSYSNTSEAFSIAMILPPLGYLAILTWLAVSEKYKLTNRSVIFSILLYALLYLVYLGLLITVIYEEPSAADY